MRRRHVVAGLLGLAALVAASLSTGPAVRAATSRVAIVVGPVGELTAEYRSLADEGARAARGAGAEVVEVYSPNATWPAVRAALQGASIVVYVGHGNGWPSRYSSVLQPETQDGLGLNPVAGVDDVAHRYFGEAYLAREVRLAPNAIVLMHRLCYASGNAEPGLPEGSLEMSRQRADNFAAGWLRSGAAAVVADAFASPAYYVRAILGGGGSIESIWRAAPTFHDHVLSYASGRTSGATELLDPTQPAAQFYRSLVWRSGSRAANGVASGTPTSPAGAIPAASSGPAVAALRLEGRPVAGSGLTLVVSLAAGKGTTRPAALGLGTRWIPLELDLAAPAGEASAPSSSPAASASGSPTAPSSSPAASASGSPTPAAPPALSSRSAGQPASPGPSAAASADPTWSATDPAQLAAEEPAAVLSTAPATSTPDGFSTAVVAPAAPGLYRLAVTLLDPGGAAYDAPTQQAVPALIVRVTGAVSATIVAPARLALGGAAAFELSLTIANTGSERWQPEGLQPMVELVGRWLALDGTVTDAAPLDAWIVGLAPGAWTAVVLAGTAPAVPGPYLLSFDLVGPTYGSLTFAGALAPAVVRVSVVGRPGNAH